MAAGARTRDVYKQQPVGAEGCYPPGRFVDGGDSRWRDGHEDRDGEEEVWRGLPMVDGRSSKHALSWQTLGWS